MVAVRFAKIGFGRLHVEFPNGAKRHFGPNDGKPAELKILSDKAISRILTNGALGLSEGYMAEEWQTDNLSYLLQILGRNMLRLEALIPRLFKMEWINRIGHHFRKNNKSGSRKNIAFHYDPGNAFSDLCLDPTLTYSPALFPQKNQPLKKA